jgi:isopenicillin-N N-acyltransferase-like protein
MHGSAEPYVAMLRVPARGPAPEAWLFTLVGCLGMTGLNAAGVGVTINNLKSHDARVGVVWPALVRALLGERRATAAHHRLVTAPLSSGHHYLLADGDVALGVETSGARKATVFRARWAETPGAAFVHTNHCHGAPTEAVSWVAPTSTTRERYAWLTASLAAAQVTGPPDLWRRLGTHDGYPRSVCTHLATAGAPHAMKTCGGLLMELRPRRLHATPGCLHGATPERFPFASEAP